MYCYIWLIFRVITVQTFLSKNLFIDKNEYCEIQFLSLGVYFSYISCIRKCKRLKMNEGWNKFAKPFTRNVVKVIQGWLGKCQLFTAKIRLMKNVLPIFLISHESKQVIIQKLRFSNQIFVKVMNQKTQKMVIILF